MNVGRRLGLLSALLGGMLTMAANADTPAGDANVAALIDGKPVTLADLDAIAIGKNMKLAQELYDARAAALDEVILNRALADEAKAQGISVDQLIQKRIAEKTKPVTDEEVAEFFNQNQARMGNRTLDQVAPQIKSHLESQRSTGARGEVMDEVRAKHTIKIVLDAPRTDMPVSDGEPTKGPKDAKITIVEFSEFQ